MPIGEVNGKRVVIRETLGARDNWDLIQRFAGGGEVKFEDMTFDETTDLVRRFVESWEFDGDPADIESYAGLDMLREYMPLLKLATTGLNDVLGRSKN